MTTTNDNPRLNEQQLAAAHSPAKETLCIAPPGSGKTSTTAERVRWLMEQGADLKDICCVTFTNAGAKALAGRITLGCQECNGQGWYSSHGSPPEQIQCEKCQGEEPKPIRLGFCGTLHALLLKLLQRHGDKVGLPCGITVMDEDEAEARLQGIVIDLRIKCTDKELREAVAFCRCNLPVEAFRNISPAQVAAREYHRRQKETGELDFDAVLEYGHRLLDGHFEAWPFKHLLVDEFQDSGDADAAIYKAVVCDTKFFVGDPDQSIFGFRGAKIEHILRLAANDEVTKSPLRYNYRSSPRLVHSTQKLISHAVARVNNPSQSPYQPQEKPATLISHSFDAPANELAYIANILAGQTDAAVLWRTNAMASQCREYLAGLGIKFNDAKRVVDAPGAKAGKAALAFMANPWSDSAALKWLEASSQSATLIKALADASLSSVAGMTNTWFCGIDPTGSWTASGFQNYLQEAKILNQWLGQLSQTLPEPFTLADLLAAAARPEEPATTGGIHVGTVHSAKGLEWDTVLVCGCEAEAWERKGQELEQERRLFYVGCTRARDSLSLTWCRYRPAAGRPWIQEPRTRSRFVEELL